MTDYSKAKIFLAEERGLEENQSCRNYQTFNFGNFFNDHKTPFGNLYALNDESFAGGYSAVTSIPENSFLLLLPVVGAISYKDSLGNTSLMNAGELLFIELPAGTDVEIGNPYDEELINYLQFRIKSDSQKISSSPMINSFDLVANKNQLAELFNISSYRNQVLKASIGQFGGREEAVYHPAHGAALFIFVIEGAFEVQGRLLHPRDGLAIWDLIEPLDMEALSNEAIIFLLEM